MARILSNHKIDESGRRLKWCPDCQAFRPIEVFGRNKGRKEGVGSYCLVHATSRSRLHHAGRRRLGMDKSELERLNMRAEIRDPAQLDAWDQSERERELRSIHRRLPIPEIRRRLGLVYAYKRARGGMTLSGPELDYLLGPAEAKPT